MEDKIKEVLGFPVIVDRSRHENDCKIEFGLLGAPPEFNINNYELVSKVVNDNIITYTLRYKRPDDV